jgi:hypothetical protein
MNPGQDSVHVCLGQLSLFDESLEAFADHVHASVNKPLLNVSEVYFTLSDLGSYLSNSVAHQTRAQNGDSLNFRQGPHLCYEQIG